MRRLATAACLPLCLALVACGGPPPVKPGNPLIGAWQLANAPGIGSRSYRKIEFRPDVMLVDGRRRIGVRHYQITATKVHFRTEDGHDHIFRVIHGDLICQEPPPEKTYLNFPSFEDERKRDAPCYRRDFANQRPDQSALRR
ncbi:MAG: hypothetical protein MI785_20545 [Kiloniellales bacterium]|nr:hypothetical protein [Kiloniellales bacterium]